MTAELRVLADSVLLPGFSGITLPEALAERLAGGLGGVTLFATNIGTPEQVRALTDSIHEANPEAVVAVDEEGGDVTRLQWRSGCSYPGNLALGVVGDLAVTEQVGAAIGGDLARAGVDLNLAPSVDVNCEPDNPVIGVRSFGASPESVCRHAAAWVRGHQSRGVAACAKHFPGHGATTSDSHHELPTLAVPFDVLATRELAPFRAAIAAGARAVLTAHVMVPALDTVPATVSRRVLTDLLRGELGFGGVVVTDALDMAGIAATMGTPAGAVRALAAGADALCLGMDHDELRGTDRVREAIAGALGSRVLGEARVRQAGERLRALARWSGHARRPTPEVDDALGLQVARRAVRVTGELRLAGPPVVVTLPGIPNMAAGEPPPGGLGAALATLLPGTQERSIADARAADDAWLRSLLEQARARPLVVAVREVHRQKEVAAVLQRLLAERPDSVVVETGFPGPHPALGSAWVRTHGGARVCLQAAAEILAAAARRPA